MKSVLLTVIFSLVVAGFTGCASKPKSDGTTNSAPIVKMPAGTNVLGDDKSKASYAIGMMLGNNFFKRQGLTTNEVDIDVAAQGMKAVQSDSEPLLTPEQAQVILKQFQQELSVKRQQEHAEIGAKNKAAGEAFLATNKDNPGVIALPDGLQYKVLTNGTGAIPTAGDTVTVNYRGTFLDGTEFDGSDKVGHPIQFEANHVIPGWTEALTKMQVGSKWQLFIPSELAYGEQGSRGIPPNSALIFEVELLDTKAAAPVAAAPPAQPLTSDIIKVPSAEEMKKGAKIETIKADDVQKMQSQTNTN